MVVGASKLMNLIRVTTFGQKSKILGILGSHFRHGEFRHIIISTHHNSVVTVLNSFGRQSRRLFSRSDT